MKGFQLFNIMMCTMQLCLITRNFMNEVSRFGLLGDKFSPPFLTCRSTRYVIGPSVGFPYLIAH
ncbi:hypothetical protein T07_3079 [Trichinella nelsoni]|uniref:Uncharacterized protein n=1 Tax=Trichinella nelsoni TaxID=6336 RepID=A0A0V0SL82_9BILA|nr:hypothetical protein T07_3079 [Trichinella nelsoni]